MSAIKDLQQQLNVNTDGIFGPITAMAYEAALLEGRISWKNGEMAAVRAEVSTFAPLRNKVDEFFGPIIYQDDPGNRGACILLNPEWAQKKLISVRVPYICCNRFFHRRASGPLIAVWAEIQQKAKDEEPWMPRQIQAYPGYPRHILWNPRKPLSLHSYGIAMDIDPATNKYGSFRTTIPAYVIQVFEAWGFGWGGRWRTPDPMHFEFCKG